MVQGSKNAALPLIAAALLCGEQTMLTNCPQIHDVEVMLSLVEELGGSVLVEGHQVMIRQDGDLSGCRKRTASFCLVNGGMSCKIW